MASPFATFTLQSDGMIPHTGAAGRTQDGAATDLRSTVRVTTLAPDADLVAPGPQHRDHHTCSRSALANFDIPSRVVVDYQDGRILTPSGSLGGQWWVGGWPPASGGDDNGRKNKRSREP